jgi:hypothetical protein
MKSKGFTYHITKTGRHITDFNGCDDSPLPLFISQANRAGDVHDGEGGQKTHNVNTVDISYFF